MNKFYLLIFVLFFSLCFTLAHASIQNFSINNSVFHDGDSIVISGKVDYDSAIPSVILQIITPDNGLAHIANIFPKNDGSFTKTIHAGGPTWNKDGTYIVKISYGGNLEKTIVYEESTTKQPSTTPTTKQPSTTPTTKQPSIPLSNNLLSENPKMRLVGFPSLDKSPQYYIDRYYDEPEYKSWFDSQFPNYSIDEVVGYQKTSVPDFPSLDKSPQYYIDRYYDEPEYKSWFDSQFPGQTLYDVLGYSTFIPDWIKTYTQNWARGDATDREFVVGLDFMLENKIIVIQNFSYSDKSSINEVPSWFKTTSSWWSDDLISQQEFINSIKYLIQHDIILIE